MLDFGKIIIYTSNLRIIPAPHRRRESEREGERESEDREAGLDQEGGRGGEGGAASKGHSHRSRGKHRTKCGHGNKKQEATSPKLKVDMAAIMSIFNSPVQKQT